MTNNYQYLDQKYTAICSEKTLQTNKNGFFMNFVKLITNSTGTAWIDNVFGKIKCDKQRIWIIYNDEKIKGPLIEILSNIEEVYRKKDAEISQGKRMQADYYYLQDEFQKALLHYSQSVLRSPNTDVNPNFDSGKTLSLALWGRSKVLIKLQEYSLALTDIQLALKEHLPDEIKAEAYWKMAICYKAIGDIKKADISFNLAEKLVTVKQKLIGLELDRSASFENAKKVKEKANNMPQVSGDGTKNVVYPCASIKIGISEDSNNGRYVTATNDIKTGETLVVEQAYIACLLPDMFGSHCHHCFERLIAPIGCHDCSNVAFCSSKCQEMALHTYHKYECKFLDLLIGSGMSLLSHMALRMITTNSLNRSLDIYKDRSKEKVYALCTNANKRSPEDFLQRTLMAAFLLRCLQKSGYFGLKLRDNVVPSEDEYAIGELLLYHLQMLQFNAHEIFETVRCTDHLMKSSKISYIGTGVYPTVALFNHDCNPGVTRHFIGKQIVIKSSRPVKRGESVAENYGPIFARKSHAERQRSLASRYWFDCQCIACVYHWPTLDGGLADVARRVKCPTTTECDYLFTLPVSNENRKCPKCHKNVCLTEQINLLKLCEQQYEMAFEKMNQSCVEEAIQILHSALDTFYRISEAPHKGTYLAQECLQVCEASFGNVHKLSIRNKS